MTFRCKRLSERRLNQMVASSMIPLRCCCCCCCLITKLCPTLRPHGLQPARLLLFMRFSRQEYWSGLPFPSAGDLPDPETEQASPAWQVDSLPQSPLGSPPLGWHARKHTKLQEWRTGRWLLISELNELKLGGLKCIL